MEIVTHARQGDVKIDVIAKLPEGLIPQPRDEGLAVLAYGELTGHKHAFKEEHVQLLANDNQLFMVITGKPATLYHEEHYPITFAPGFYQIRIQREFVEGDEPLRVCE
ncbi:MAG: hypothetical protein ACAH80_00685 [Alphaproteobacteria bacterium]